MLSRRKTGTFKVFIGPEQPGFAIRNLRAVEETTLPNNLCKHRSCDGKTSFIVFTSVLDDEDCGNNSAVARPRHPGPGANLT